MKRQARLVFDLDHTICIPNLEFAGVERRYAQAQPIQHVIDIMRRLHEEGAYIIIHTARRMVTHDGNLAEIEREVGDLTRKWLADHGVPYDELVFGKPYGDLYIDDKALPVEHLLASGSNLEAWIEQ